MGLRWKGIEYSVRENHLARRVILRVPSANRLDVVVPRRFNRRRLPEIFQAHRDWIQRELQRVQALPAVAAPRQIDLQSIDQLWRLKYLDDGGLPSSPEEAAGRILEVDRDAGDVEAVARDLNGWLQQKARAHLAPWLRKVSVETGIPFQKITIRGQATRWGSCSKQHNISLNRSLLFLPPPLVRHVFLHELCHVKRLDHSPTFWRLLQEMEPKSRALEAEVRQANRYVPSWVSLGKSR
jgi:predicted metal-dependent hydrolase